MDKIRDVNVWLNLITIVVLIAVVIMTDLSRRNADRAVAELQRMMKWIERTYGMPAETTDKKPWNRNSRGESLLE